MTDELVTSQTLNESTIELQIELKAAPEKVYAAWTRLEVFQKWFGPRAGSLQVDNFDCSIGGSYDMTMIFADGDRTQLTGTYLELDPPRKIVFTWYWTNGSTVSDETLVTIDLLPSETGTHLTLTHERLISDDARNNYQQGWGALLRCLASVISSQ